MCASGVSSRVPFVADGLDPRNAISSVVVTHKIGSKVAGRSNQVIPVGRAKQPGKLVQINHMSVAIGSTHFKD